MIPHLKSHLLTEEVRLTRCGTSSSWQNIRNDRNTRSSSGTSWKIMQGNIWLLWGWGEKVRTHVVSLDIVLHKVYGIESFIITIIIYCDTFIAILSIQYCKKKKIGNRIADCGRNACEFVSHVKSRGKINTCAVQHVFPGMAR